MPTCNWKGASADLYTYHIHKLPVNFDSGQIGNYIYAKLNSDNKWVPIYIGEGELCDRCSDQHHRADCIGRRGATHVHAHLNADEDDRLAEEQDLLARYTNAYAPSGCNIKQGG